jgi:hypothetical protein
MTPQDASVGGLPSLLLSHDTATESCTLALLSTPGVS